jgi:hypothetical protein
MLVTRWIAAVGALCAVALASGCGNAPMRGSASEPVVAGGSTSATSETGSANPLHLKLGFECVTRLHVEAHAAGPLPNDLLSAISLQGQARWSECGAACVDTPALSAHYLSQYTQAFCGVASSVMVLNASAVAKPTTPPYAPYAFFTQCNIFNERALQRIDLDQVEKAGLTLAQATWLLNSWPGVNAHCHHAGVSDNGSGDGFESPDGLPRCTVIDDNQRFEIIAQRALSTPGDYVIANFSRAPLSNDNTGGGHFSPLGGYHEASGSYLVFDVARYKYPPFWVEGSDLWRAMKTTDSASRENRGFIVVETNQ